MNMLKSRKSAVVSVISAVVLLAAAFAFLPAPAAAQDTLVPHIAQGRLTFVKVCGTCHGIDKPEKKDMDRPAWDALITNMQAKGAQMTPEERELILDYLGIRNIFLAKCTSCHTTERILDTTQPFAGWEKTVVKMMGIGPNLMTEEEARSITAYLAAVRGVEPAAK
jgi:mono/diheme cytochrome c family protein